jgi:hypothetical protein
MSPKATRATELNAAISQLWQDQATHSKADFNQQIVPIYTQLLDTLKNYQSQQHAEQQLLDLLKNTAKACRTRWTTRLPMKRPGSDYRKYELIYTDALITAMAIEQVQKHNADTPPEQLAAKHLPATTLTKLRTDPIVWEDWLGYFQQKEQGGLYAVANGKIPTQIIKRPKNKTPRPTPQNKPPPPGSGRAMLEAIKSALKDGTLSYNQPQDFIQVDRAGRTFLEHPKVLRWCGERLGLDEDLKKLKSRFSRLKVIHRSQQGRQLFQGRRGKQDHRRVGYLLDNPSVLWQGEPPAGQFIIEGING